MYEKMLWNLRAPTTADDATGGTVKLCLLVGPDSHHTARLPVPNLGVAFELLARPFKEWDTIAFRAEQAQMGKSPDVTCPLPSDAFTEAIRDWNEMHAEENNGSEHGTGWKWLGLAVGLDTADEKVSVWLTLELNQTIGQVVVDRDVVESDAVKLLTEFADRAKAVLR